MSGNKTLQFLTGIIKSKTLGGVQAAKDYKRDFIINWINLASVL